METRFLHVLAIPVARAPGDHQLNWELLVRGLRQERLVCGDRCALCVQQHCRRSAAES